MRVFIWGTGREAHNYMQYDEINNHQLMGFIETNKSKEQFYDYRVYEPEEISESDYDAILVLVHLYGRDIILTCIQNGIDLDKVVLIDNRQWNHGGGVEKYCQFDKYVKRIHSHRVDVKKYFPKLYNYFIRPCELEKSFVVSHRCSVDIKGDTHVQNNSGWEIDYFRYRTFELVAQEISSRKITGDVAELGVGNCGFAPLINIAFPEKKFYIFDTFSSFDVEELSEEISSGRCLNGVIGTYYGKTTPDDVLKMLAWPEMVELKKGYFPESTNGMSGDTYCFVSIDVDLKVSTFEGLRYFYPRMSSGGYIFLHDYNCFDLFGVREAVKCYEEEIGELLVKVPLADRSGSLVVCKP